MRYKSLYYIFFLAILPTHLWARTFFVKASGNDAGSGLSITDAWKSTVKVNSVDFNINDTVLFEAGSTFDGGIYLSEEDSAGVLKPLYISSYGIGRAKIYGHKNFGLYAYNVGTVHIDNINFAGLGADSSTGSGVFFYTDNPSGKKYKQIKLTNLDISGFENGIQLGSWHNTYPGYSNIHISKVNAVDNLKNGISTYDMAEKTSVSYAHDSLHMDHCYFGNNGFSGIVLGGINYGLIERTKASRSGQLHNKGVVGIWCWNSGNITFQYCVADSTRTDGGDGGGFDIDGGTENCIVQYCYSFFNDGPGFMHCDYPQSRATKNNTIRYNITESDGQQPYKDKSSLCFISWGTGLNDCHIYNNTSYISNKTNGIITGLQGNILDDYDVAPNMHNCNAVNNIIYATGDSNNLVKLYQGKAFSIDTSGIKFAYNNYFSVKTSSQKWNDGGTVYFNLSDWQTTTKQEMFTGKKTGNILNPQLKNPGTGGAILFRQIDSLHYLLQGYTLLKTSVMIDSGMNISAAKGLNIGKSDFYLNTPLAGITQDIGCNESQFGTLIKEQKIAEPKAFPNPFHDALTIVLDKNVSSSSFILYNTLGQKVISETLTRQQNEIETTSIPAGYYFISLDNNFLASPFVKY
ncbi:MAG: T9SS type A sorting domain-containing protein [Chitinophagaceae bacterium]|jgi:hypothetical protein